MFFKSSISLLNISCIFLVCASILFPGFWIIFTIITMLDCLSLLHLVVLVGFYLDPSSAIFLSHLILSNLLCLWSPFHRLQEHSFSCFWCLSPGGLGWPRSLCRLPACPPVCLVPLVGRSVSRDMFWAGCELSTILGSLSADKWGCVPVLLVVGLRRSSNGACRLWGGTSSWCLNGDLQESSF